MVYARDTSVSVNRTREEIIATLERYGADAFGYAQDGNQQAVFFRMEGRRVRLLVEMPDPEEFALTPTGIKRAPEAQRRQVGTGVSPTLAGDAAADQGEAGRGSVGNHDPGGGIPGPHLLARWQNRRRVYAATD